MNSEQWQWRENLYIISHANNIIDLVQLFHLINNIIVRAHFMNKMDEKTVVYFLKVYGKWKIESEEGKVSSEWWLVNGEWWMVNVAWCMVPKW